MPDIPFRRDMTFSYGVLEPLTPLVRRIVARNPGPFTLHGTHTFVVGSGAVAVIDPGPDDAAHIEALLAALGEERVSHICVTHSHADHSPGARILQDRTGAPVYGFGPHGSGRAAGDIRPLERGDLEFDPDLRLADGDLVQGTSWSLEAVYTPGHASNHLAFALLEEKSLFCGDAVMAWSTAVIAPPDGDMASYLATLHKLLARDDATYWPAHGPSIDRPRPFVEAYLEHRLDRERQVIACLRDGIETIPQIVDRVYKGLNPKLVGAAGLSVRAHLDHLIEKGLAGRSNAPDGAEVFHITTASNPQA